MKRFSFFMVSLVFGFCIFSLPGIAIATSCEGADLIVQNAHVVTMDNSNTMVEAMAVRDGRIVATGTNKQIETCAGPSTKRIDLTGKTVLPGLIDIHTHALEWAKGIVRNQIDATFPGTKSIITLVGAVKNRVQTVAPSIWIIGAGWDDAKYEERRYLTRQDLDPVSPNNPVYLVHVSGHLGVANSKALAVAGITRDTPDPSGGVIERDANGEPTGIVKDAAMVLVAGVLPPESPQVAVQAVKVVSDQALAVGLTTIHDINLFEDDLHGYQIARRQGLLKIRVQMVPGVRNLSDAEMWAHSGLTTGLGDDQLKLGAIKFFADGGMGARTIAIYPPPVQNEPNNLGLLIWKTDELQKAHHDLAQAGWQIVTHAIGDRAIDQVLDSYAATIKDLNLQNPRFRIAHCGISTPAVQKRLKELNVIPDGNPAFVYWLGGWFKKYGPERVRWSYPGKSYIENGIIEGAGSDVPVTPISPWWGIWAAVAREEIFTDQVLAPEERLTIQEALRLYTRNGAYIGFEEKEKGSLEPGKLADFIVVDRDVLTVPTDELKDVQVLQTFVGGILQFRKP